MATKTIPGNPSAKPDMGPSKKPPMGMKPGAKMAGKPGNGGKRSA